LHDGGATLPGYGKPTGTPFHEADEAERQADAAVSSAKKTEKDEKRDFSVYVSQVDLIWFPCKLYVHYLRSIFPCT